MSLDPATRTYGYLFIYFFFFSDLPYLASCTFRFMNHLPSSHCQPVPSSQGAGMKFKTDSWENPCDYHVRG